MRVHRGGGGGVCKHTRKKRHICSLLIKGKEKTLSKYKVAQGHFDLPCWVLQTFKALFVQLGKCIKHRILVCVEAALKAELSQVLPRLHCWCHLLNTLVQGENQQVTFCSLPPDIQKSIDQELKATGLFNITAPLLLCPCPSSPSFLRPRQTPLDQPNAETGTRYGAEPHSAVEHSRGEPTHQLATKLRHHLPKKGR